jgi:hypothetical protein
MKFSLKGLKIPAAGAVPAQAGISVFHHPNRLQKKYLQAGQKHSDARRAKS